MFELTFRSFKADRLPVSRLSLDNTNSFEEQVLGFMSKGSVILMKFSLFRFYGALFVRLRPFGLGGCLWL